MLEFGKISADGQEFLQLSMTGDKDDSCSAMFEDVGHAVGRFVEVNRDGDAAGAGDGEVRGVPFGTICGEKTDAIAWLHAEFDKRCGKAANAAMTLRKREGRVP